MHIYELNLITKEYRRESRSGPGERDLERRSGDRGWWFDSPARSCRWPPSRLARRSPLLLFLGWSLSRNPGASSLREAFRSVALWTSMGSSTVDGRVSVTAFFAIDSSMIDSGRGGISTESLVVAKGEINVRESEIESEFGRRSWWKRQGPRMLASLRLRKESSRILPSE